MGVLRAGLIFAAFCSLCGIASAQKLQGVINSAKGDNSENVVTKTNYFAA
jgi:hypothetical protein